jgi:putative hydrolase of the HAD superfamily
MSSRPEIAHDVTAIRRLSLRDLLSHHGYSPVLADDGIRLFLDNRNRVEPYADVVPALSTLGADYRLVSVTNGNSDVSRTPLRGLFHLSLTAADVGAQKPDPALFLCALEWGRSEPYAALHLGDDPYHDVEAARRIGMAAVWVNRKGMCWPEALEPPVAEVANLTEFRQWIVEV